MNPAVLDIDEQAGDLVSGYFFYLERFDPYDDVEVDCDGQILGIGDDKDWKRAVTAAYVGSKQSEVFDCHVSKKHLTWELVESLKIETLRGEQKVDLIRSDAPYLIVNRSLRDAIENSSLKGAHFCPVTILRKDPVTPNVELFGLTPQPNVMCRLSSIQPAEANQCFNCGDSPICCPACGQVEYDCPRCGAEVTVDAAEHGGANDPRIKIIPGTGGYTPIVEVGKWDGKDFLGTASQPLVVTKRVIEFLLARNSSLFRATPLRANIAGISEEKKQMLENARRLPD